MSLPRVGRDLPICPSSKFNAYHDSGKGNAVVKAGAIIRRLRVYAHKDNHDKTCNYRSNPGARVHEGIKRGAVVEFDKTNASTNGGTDQNIQKPMHATV